MFRHHPDGIIFIDEVQISLAEFMIDEPLYSLPAPYIGRDYNELTKKHRLYTSNSQSPGEDWPEGDVYVSKKNTYLTNIEGRKSPIPVLTARQKFESDPSLPSYLELLEAVVDNSKGDSTLLNKIADDVTAAKIKHDV